MKTFWFGLASFSLCLKLSDGILFNFPFHWETVLPNVSIVSTLCLISDNNLCWGMLNSEASSKKWFIYLFFPHQPCLPGSFLLSQCQPRLVTWWLSPRARGRQQGGSPRPTVGMCPTDPCWSWRWTHQGFVPSDPAVQPSQWPGGLLKGRPGSR